jgi:hypothetical protein
MATLAGETGLEGASAQWHPTFCVAKLDFF